MPEAKHRICPVAMSGSLDNCLRRWVQDPRKILKPYIRSGMTVLDLGCGPGFFSIDLARMVGPSGRVIAADLQEGMLRKLQGKIQGTDLERRVILHRCEAHKLGLSEKIDFVLAFYMVHEVPDQDAFFGGIKSILKPGGKLFIVEPPFHVSRTAFEKTVRKAERAGLQPVGKPKVFLGKTVLLQQPRTAVNAPSGSSPNGWISSHGQAAGASVMKVVNELPGQNM